MNILITGCSGFVGKQVLKYIEGERNRIFVTLRKKSVNFFKEKEKLSGVIEVEDIFSLNVSEWYKILKNIDVIIHIAWYADHGKYLNSVKNIDCLKGTMIMAKAAVAAKVKKIVGIGTCFEYDLECGKLKIDSPLCPLTPYGAAKAASYFLLKKFLSRNNITFAWCRLFYLYGEGENPMRLAPYIKSQLSKNMPVILRNGNLVRDFLDVKVAAKHINEIALTNREGVFNICSGKGITVEKFALKIAKELNKEHLIKSECEDKNQSEPLAVVGVKNI